MKTIPIKGTIVSDEDKWVYNFFGIAAACPKDIRDALTEAAGEDVTVEINSGGGDLFAGSEMYYHLTTYSGKLLIDITGLAASAASVVAMAGHSRIAPTGMMVIHNVSSYASGDYRNMDHESETLRNADKAVANAYRLKTGLSEADLLALMDVETSMDASRAVERGFVDEIIQPQEAPRKLYNVQFANVLSPETIAKVRSIVKNPADKAAFLNQKIKVLKLKEMAE